MTPINVTGIVVALVLVSPFIIAFLVTFIRSWIQISKAVFSALGIQKREKNTTEVLSEAELKTLFGKE